MSELVSIGRPTKNIPREGVRARRPDWLRVKVTHSDTFKEVGELLSGLQLNTVCEEARCPNIWECWGQHRTATFMILGDVCTRACRYCSVTSGRPPSLPDPEEPEHVAEAVARLGLKHAVITSVDRDDIPDYGSGHWAATIEAVRRRAPGTHIEVLIPDFLGEREHLERVLDARPDVLNHNMETVPSLFRRMRSKGVYERSLDVLRMAHEYRVKHQIPMTTKSGMMVGLGETVEEVHQVMADLRGVECDVYTVGQYLNPTKKHAPIARFYEPAEFAAMAEHARSLGFKHVESGPLVRSSYHAHEHVPAP